MRNPRPGIAALLEVAQVSPRLTNGFTIGWTIGPRLNAAGRLGDPMDAYRLLVAPDVKSAWPLAEKLDKINRERQGIVKRATEKCLENYDKSDFPVLVGPWPRGVVGIVAGRIVEHVRRPALVGSLEKGIVRASGRSIGNFDILGALDESPELFTRYGGHKAACGLEFDVKALPDVSVALARAARRKLRLEDTVEIIDLAGRIHTPPTVEEVTALDVIEPCGEANPDPVFLLTGEVQSVRQGKGWQLVWVQGVKMFVPPEFKVEAGTPVHAAIKLGLDEFRGNVTVQGRVVDIRRFSYTRKNLAQAFPKWCGGQTVDTRITRIIEELGITPHGVNSKPNLLQSQTFQKYGVLMKSNELGFIRASIVRPRCTFGQVVL